MKIGVQVKGLAETKLRLAGLERKIKVVTKAALNDAAYLGTKKTAEEIAKVFDRPTPWVKGGVRYVKATSEKLEAKIDLDKWGNKTGVTVDNVLAAQINAGQRKHKRHERALQIMGILPAGHYIVPGEAAELDQYGNMAASQIRQILSYLNAAQMTSGYAGNMTQKRRDALKRGSKKTGGIGFEYFAVAPGARRQYAKAGGGTGSHKMQPGIYKRIHLGHGTAIKPVMIFVRGANYSKRLDLYGIIERSARPEFERAFNQYANQMLKERGL